MLSPLAGLFDPAGHPDVLVGMGVADDAAVYRINAKTAVLATLDFFAPVVDDPYTYGAIAAANALSDVYAMGGEAVLALNIAAFPQDLPAEVQTAILRGGAETVKAAGAVIAGGHTVWDAEPKYGLSVLGLVHPTRILSKAGLKAGDRLYLTKSLGTGAILSGQRQGKAKPEWVEAATASMVRLNRHASHLAREVRLSAATDITGFGLLGHLWEMADRSGVGLELAASAVPLLPGARECSAAGVHTGGEERNRAWLGGHVSFAPSVDETVAALMFDPQTSGGLLLAAS
ncbi:MAG: selenide, water dikinase SelD, partial [Dehalococcoidia bacterium]|nr:selenide, water dikinase SelD [Dehalococcoidia bacterium]